MDKLPSIVNLLLTNFIIAPTILLFDCGWYMALNSINGDIASYATFGLVVAQIIAAIKYMIRNVDFS